MRNQAVLTTPSGRSVRPKKVVESHDFQGTALSNKEIGAKGAGDDSSAAGRPASAPGGESMQDMSEGRTPRTPTKPRVLDYNTIWAGSGSAPASPARPPSASGNLSSVSSEQLLSEQSTTCRNMGAMFEKTGSLNKALDMFNQHLILAQRSLKYLHFQLYTLGAWSEHSLSHASDTGLCLYGMQDGERIPHTQGAWIHWNGLREDG